MKKILDLFRKYKMVFLIALTIIILGLVFMFIFMNRKINTNTYSSKYYTFNYDEKWKIVEKSDPVIKLKNSNKASLSIKTITLNDEYKYSDISEIIDNLLYTISSQNKNYKLISKVDSKVTKALYKGYRLLYENTSSQVMIVVTKIGDKLVLFNYEAENKYFDILLDSVHNIIYNFKVKSDSFKLSYKLSVDTGSINYSSNDKLKAKLKNTKKYDIASKNYAINYSLPSIFKLTSMNSSMGTFSYSDDDNNKIYITTNVFNSNIYDYIDSSKSYGTIYSDYNYLKNKKFTAKLSEFKMGKYDGYIYKVSYKDTELVEAYTIAIAINKNHIFLIKIEGKNIKIPEELIKLIQINSITNYSSYIKKNTSNGISIVELKRFMDYNYKEYDSIKIKLLEKYKEKDMDNNVYSDRYFGLNYDQNNDVYQYNIHYILSSTSYPINSQIEVVNSNMDSYKSYGEIEKMTAHGTKNLNGKNFLLYDGSFYNREKLYNSSDESVLYKTYRKMLIYELESGGCLSIIIDGNNIDLDDNILNELSNFEITKEVYK